MENDGRDMNRIACVLARLGRMDENTLITNSSSGQMSWRVE